MAFTSRAPREAGKVDVSTPVNLGPGSYDPSFKHEAHHASAPKLAIVQKEAAQ